MTSNAWSRFRQAALAVRVAAVPLHVGVEELGDGVEVT
jgi:hypothetical protein